MKLASLLLLAVTALNAQIFNWSRDEVVRYTPKNPFERFEDGRPKVPDNLLKELAKYTVEDVWVVLDKAGFRNQYDGDWRVLAPGTKVVGRVVTAQYMPVRPDVAEIISADAKKKGFQGGPNQWVLDMLQPGDVLVVDIFGKQQGGTFVGGNLAFYVYAKTGNGFIINGAVRDLEEITNHKIPGYVRSVHPTPIADVMLTGINVPIRIGNTTVLPGDVVLGDRSGVYFIPPHLVQEVITKGEETVIHDVWTKDKFREGKWKSSDIYGSPRDEKLKAEYKEYLERELKKLKK